MPDFILNEMEVAEGMVSAPFLPPDDQDHKGGFAPLQLKGRMAANRMGVWATGLTAPLGSLQILPAERRICGDKTAATGQFGHVPDAALMA
jgi:hypothetical protein